MDKRYYKIRKALGLSLLLILLTVSISTYGQEHNNDRERTRVSLSFKDKPLLSVFKSIERQTGVRFNYSNDIDVTQRVTITQEKASLETALSSLLSPINYTWKLLSNQIFIINSQRNQSEAAPTDANTRDDAFTLIGTVTDAEGNAIPGASVALTSETQGVTTDENGEFKLRNVRRNDQIKISSIGYETREINVNGARLLVRLNLMVNKLEEVDIVSTGYQNLPKERLTGSFERVNSKTLNERVTPNILSRLEGLSSVYFDKSGERPSLVVRGYGSILGSNAPLIIVDNFPFEGDINRLNPFDIASITILKDAAAASIWGTRAGNGVIVIKTKQATYNQKLEVTLNSNVTISKQPDLFYLPQMSSPEFIDFEQELFNQGYYTGLESNRYSRPALSPVVELLIKQRDGIITDAASQIDRLRTLSARNSFMDELYQNPLAQQHTVSVKGGDQKANYYLSIGYIGNVDEKKASDNRITLSSQANYQLSPKIRVNINLGLIQRNTVSGAPGFLTMGNILQPYSQLTDESGNPASLPKIRKPYTDTAGAGKLLDWNYYPLTDYKHSKSKGSGQNTLVGITFHYNITKSLELTGSYNYQRQNDQVKALYDIQSWYTRDLINKFSSIDWNTGQVTYKVPYGGILDNANAISTTNNGRGQLSYNKTTGDFQVNAIAGFELRDNKISSSAYRNYGYDPNVLTVSTVDFSNSYPGYINGVPAFIPQNSVISEKNNHFVSTYLNASMTLKEKYLVSGSARRDASNLFGVNTNEKWVPLWSSGIAWNISNEKWYKLPLVQYLKLRATYGYAGSVDLRRSSVTSLLYVGTNPYNGFPRAMVNQFPNPDLRWEKTRTINIGADFMLKNDIFSGSAEVYSKKGIDLLGISPIDRTAGVGPTVERNVANMVGRGVELNLRSTLTNKLFTWNSNIIFNYNKTKITDYYLSSEIGNDFITSGLTIKPIVGKPVYSILAYKWAGLDNEGNPQGIANDKISTDYYDLIGSGTKVQDLVYGGSAVPTYFGSFINSFQWKELTVSFNIMYKFGYSFLKPSINYYALANGVIGNSDYTNRWRSPGDETKTSVPSFTYPFNYARDWFYNNSEVLIRKGDHIRLSYINLNYELPQAVVKPIGLRQLQFYFSAANLGIIWRANDDGLDPDYINNLIPPGKSYSIGLQASF